MKRLTRWKITSPWFRVPHNAKRVRMVMVGRWKMQRMEDNDDEGVPGAPVPAVPKEPEGGEDAE